jgi:hypothetical protein
VVPLKSPRADLRTIGLTQRGERRRSRLLKRMKESGWCEPTIASGRVDGGQLIAGPPSSRPVPYARWLEASRRRIGDEVRTTSAARSGVNLATSLPLAEGTQTADAACACACEFALLAEAGEKRISKICD